MSGLNVTVQEQEHEESGEGQVTEFQQQTENNKPEYEEEQEEEMDYRVDSMLPKQNQKEKLIEQNIKLKTQIYELAVQLDEILSKDKQKKKRYGLSTDDEDEAVRAKKLELKKQELQIVEVKNRIFELKRQLESVFNSQLVQEQEDKLKHVKKRLREVEEEKDGLLKIKKGQAKAIKTIKNEQQFRQKIDKTHKEVMRVKQQTQKLMEKALQARKQEVNCHQKYVMQKQKIRQLEAKLALNAKSMKQKQKSKSTGNAPMAAGTGSSNSAVGNTISNQLISELEEEIKRLELEKREGEKVWQDKIRAIEIEIQFKRQQEQRKMLILREKEKESKLNEIRIRELRKLVKQNIIDQNVKKGEDMDMSQYRHRRNIRYIQK